VREASSPAAELDDGSVQAHAPRGSGRRSSAGRTPLPKELAGTRVAAPSGLLSASATSSLPMFCADVGKVDQDVSILRDVADVFQNVADIACNMKKNYTTLSQHVSMLRRYFFHLNKFDSDITDLNVAPDVGCCNH
jgi:hypothetical protein